MILKTLKALIFRQRTFSFNDWKEMTKGIEDLSQEEIVQTLTTTANGLDKMIKDLDDQIQRIEILQEMIAKKQINLEDKEVSDQIKVFKIKINASMLRLKSYQHSMH